MILDKRIGGAVTVFATKEGRVAIITAPPHRDDIGEVEFVALGEDEFWHYVPPSADDQMMIVPDEMSEALNLAWIAGLNLEHAFVASANEDGDDVERVMV